MLDKLALILTIIGGINWGLIGIFQFDLVAWICGGQGSIISRIIYTIVALAAIWCISLLFREHDTVAEGHHAGQNKAAANGMPQLFILSNANRSEPNKRLNRNIPQNPESGQQKHQYPTKARVVPRVWQLIAASEYLNTVTKHGVAN